MENKFLINKKFKKMTKILNTIKDTAFLLRNLSEKEQENLNNIKI